MLLYIIQRDVTQGRIECAWFEAYTGTYNDICNTIFYFRKLHAPRSVPAGGTPHGIHVFAGFVDKIFWHFRPAIRYHTLSLGSRDLHELLPIWISVGAPALWRSVMQIDQVSQEPLQRHFTEPFFPLEVHIDAHEFSCCWKTYWNIVKKIMYVNSWRHVD